jgi:hypothetical protein
MYGQSWIWFSPDGWGFYFTLYVGAQLFTLLVLRGRFLRIALWAIPVMLLVLLSTYIGEAEKSNLWPLPLIMVSPVALVYVATVCIVSLVATLYRRLIAGRHIAGRH